MKKTILKKYAQLMVRVGANVQKDEEVFITSQTQTAEFAKAVALAAYKAGAKRVTVNWYDDELSRIKYENETKETLTDIHDWVVRRSDEIVERKGVMIHIISDNPMVFEGISPQLIGAVSKESSLRCKKLQDSTMSGNTRWTLAAYPNEAWAKIIFGDEYKKGSSIKKLWEMIACACRLNEPNPVKAWKTQQQLLDTRRKVLNDAKIKTLRYKNSLGTDFTIGLPKDYIFKGGADKGSGKVMFTPNIPTEEVFTAPLKTSCNGKVVASMPLIYSGNKIDGFWIRFKDGKAVEFGAKQNEEFLKELIETDEGSHYLGEVALVGYNSPIQNLKTLFYNTLFDENASCHLALGRAYPDCIKNGSHMTLEQQQEAGINYSLEHEDFMIGTSDLSIVAQCENGKELVIFENGDWAF